MTMVLIIEMDLNWTVGIEWGCYVKGLRLGFIAIHIMPCTFDKVLASMKRIEEKEAAHKALFGEEWQE